MRNSLWIVCIDTCMLTSCESLKGSSKYLFVEGYYEVLVKGNTVKLYVLTSSDMIKAKRSRDISGEKIDTTHAFNSHFHPSDPIIFRQQVLPGTHSILIS